MERFVDLVNREAEALLALQPPLPKTALRGAMRERLGEAFAYPLGLEFRALIAGERDAEGRCLEAVPEGLTRDAASLIGPILLRTDRPLQAGSVVRAKAVLEDPRSRPIDVPGLRALAVSIDAEVAVEP